MLAMNQCQMHNDKYLAGRLFRFTKGNYSYKPDFSNGNKQKLSCEGEVNRLDRRYSQDMQTS